MNVFIPKIMEKERLQKYIASCGVCSRRAAEKLIEQGRVSVDGTPAYIGQKVDGTENILVSGHKINEKKKHTYIAYYKPRGVITTVTDNFERKSLSEVIKKINTRVFPVGRLDKDSEGFLLLTDDGALANKIMHPSCYVEKMYRVVVAGKVSDEAIEELNSPMDLDGEELLPAQVRRIDIKPDRTVWGIIISQGKNRQIRRMCEKVDLSVLRLKREKIGKLSIGHLRSGEMRHLTEKEVSYLKSL